MGYHFPNIAVKDKEKDEKYHLAWATAITSTSFGGDWSLNYNKMKMLYDFYLFGTGNDITGHLTTAPDGSAMPGIWTSQNTVKTRIRNLIGELEERSYVIKAKATNIEAQARKLEEKERLRVRRKLQDLIATVEENTGISLESPEYVPQNDEELREYMDLTWKDKHVVILEGALKWLALRNEDDESRKRALLDQFIGNHSIARVEIVNGLPRIRLVDPLKFGYDRNCTDDMLSDSTYFYEFFYEPLASVAQRYDLTLEELQESQTNYGDGLNNFAQGDVGFFGCMPGQVNRWYMDDGGPKALVIKIVWRDFKTLIHKSESKPQYDTEFFQDVSDSEYKERDKDKLVTNRLECWRQATLIGGQFLREWGECVNQPRDLSTLARSQSPYVVWKNESFQGNVSSMAEQLLGLQVLKDVALYQLQVQMARASGKVLVFDKAMLDEGTTTEKIAREIKADGVTFINTKEYQNQTGSMNLFQEFDLALSQTVGQLIQIVAYFDDQMSQMSGVTPERMGEIQGTGISTGTTKAALVRSSMTTATFFKAFERWWSRCLQHEARLVKLAFADKEKFAPIIGDVGVDFLADNIDIDLDEFDVFVQSREADTESRAILMSWLGLAVQSGEVAIADAMDIAREPDIDVAIRMYQRKTKLRQRRQAQAEAEAAEAEQRAMEQQLAFEAQQKDKELAATGEIEANKTQAGIQKQLIGSRTKLNQEKLRLMDR